MRLNKLIRQTRLNKLYKKNNYMISENMVFAIYVGGTTGYLWYKIKNN